ncbi:hypothetical protein LCE32_05965 [Streptomyces sp. 7G]|uniref:hypothetical protein n=1 Tax=Streptomyces sp. 7G TaxID=2877241 RepID=UPI001CD2BB2B|nr:hypothetical protein [Streptomyces sp. 7G]MCA1269612.1 hypothetical protein [Streptomyces sp. 7G]
MRATESQKALADDLNETNNLTVAPEAPSTARRNRPARPDVAAEPDALHGPFERTRSLAHLARAKKATVSADRFSVAAAGDEEDLKGRASSPLERADALLSVLQTIAGTHVLISATPTALHADIKLSAELSETEHRSLLDALSQADQFGHSITGRDGEKVWALYKPISQSGPLPRGSGPATLGASVRPVPATEPATFYTTREGSRDGEYRPPV